jgi:hypothetical protein
MKRIGNNRLINEHLTKKKEIIMILPLLLFNVISSLVIDKATDLATEHVESMINDLLPDDAKKELDEIIASDPSHTFDNAQDALMGAVEGKLPISLADGTLKPIEINFKVTYNPTDGSVDIEKS